MQRTGRLSVRPCERETGEYPQASAPRCPVKFGLLKEEEPDEALGQVDRRVLTGLGIKLVLLEVAAGGAPGGDEGEHLPAAVLLGWGEGSMECRAGRSTVESRRCRLACQRLPHSRIRRPCP